MADQSLSSRRFRARVVGSVLFLAAPGALSPGATPPTQSSVAPAGADMSRHLKMTMRLENVGSVTPNARRYDISPDWALLAAPKDDGSVLLFDVATGQPLPPLTGGFKVGTFTYANSAGTPPSYFGFSADGRFLT